MRVPGRHCEGGRVPLSKSDLWNSGLSFRRLFVSHVIGSCLILKEDTWSLTLGGSCHVLFPPSPELGFVRERDVRSVLSTGVRSSSSTPRRSGDESTIRGIADAV